MKHIPFLLLTLFFFSSYFSQIIPNGKIDNIDELTLKTTTYTKSKDGIKLATDIYVPVFRDSITTNITIGANSYPIELIKKNTQFVIFDTANLSANNFKLPIVFTRTPYNKNYETIGGKMFPFLGYGYAIQDMRGRYSSEGVYFPMYSDAWQKNIYHPNLTIPMDLYPSTNTSNALFHSDGSESVFYLSDSIFRNFDVDLDGVNEVFTYSNGKIGMFGASALGNSQYQALSNIPHSQLNNPIKCLLPIVATNEHYNTTIVNNGVFRHSLMRGWMTGQIDDLSDSLAPYDNSLANSIHTPTDYGYLNKAAVTKDLIDWYVANDNNNLPSGTHPNSPLRVDLDASFAPVNALGQTDANGTFSRYSNLNKPIYHLTGWWDIFINGQIETFNKVRSSNPTSLQKLIVGPWTHQTVGSNVVGDEIYPNNVFDVLGFDYSFDIDSILTDPSLLSKIYNSEMLGWFRTNLGGEPFFFIPESNTWQPLGSNLVRVPSKNYFAPYYQFLNYLGGKGALNNLPIEINNGSSITSISYNLPTVSPPLIPLQNPLQAHNLNYFNNVKNVRAYITGPSNDLSNPSLGNFWLETDSLPFSNGVVREKFFLHQNLQADKFPPTINEGNLSYIADPNNPVITVGGNNMIPILPGGSTQKSQGSINVANPNYAPYTLNRSDVLSFETSLLTNTITVIGFPRASLYAKGNTTTYTSTKTDFDLMVRVIDVYPDGREMFITEGTVNAKARNYAKSIFNGTPNESIQFDNIDNNTFYNFEFEMLPLGHIFGVGHKIKFLISSSNYPRYQSNPHVPNNINEFFRWAPGDTIGYNYAGTWMHAQQSQITLSFNPNYPSYIELPNVTVLPTNVVSIEKKDFLDIFPNPTNEFITINRRLHNQAKILIYSILGDIVFYDNFNENELSKIIDLSNVTSGVYLVNIIYNNGTNISKKIVKQ